MEACEKPLRKQQEALKPQDPIQEDQSLSVNIVDFVFDAQSSTKRDAFLNEGWDQDLSSSSDLNSVEAHLEQEASIDELHNHVEIPRQIGFARLFA